ncbi:dihydrolipoamide acetyltransferase family protein [Saccharopolyspora sp. ID03-671]|uniref:dihydrolipoamide acetyltransferase family protein n=1 Tax=Saccharopolyspora sp. ID03-671 TaxID=3073066 RepID=UPI003251CCDC
MSTRQFALPDVGEGLTEAEIVNWRVAVGDEVTLNQTIVEIETAKSVVELPSPHEGAVSEILVGEGETVTVGTPIIVIGTGDVVSEPAAGSRPEKGASPAAATAEPPPAVLVGYGPTESTKSRRRRRAPAAEADAASVPNAGTAVRAKPPVRKLAKDLGVDLARVKPSGPERTISRQDVLALAETASPPEAPVLDSAVPAQETSSVRSGAEGRVTRIPVRGVRKATAAAMSASAFTAPHVTEFLTIDVTRSVRLVDELKADPAFEGRRVTLLLLVARALLAAVREFPDINASWDDEAGEIVLHHQVNLGIAAATPRGLMVPNIKNADSFRLPELASELTELTRTAREGKSTPEDMARGTITITNIGVFGVDAGTPILNPGEAAILCAGAVRKLPWEHKGKVKLRSTMQLSLSFDHRMVDGELGSRVLVKVGRVLENPTWELLLS